MSWTSGGDCRFNGITRKKPIQTWAEVRFTVREKDCTLAEFYGADGAFVTSTLGGITRVARIGGRATGSRHPAR